MNDSSYSVAGAGLKGLVALDAGSAYTLAKKYSADAKDGLSDAISDILIEQGTEADFDFIANAYRDAPSGQTKVEVSEKFGSYLMKLNDLEKIKTGIGYILDFRNMIPAQYWPYIDPSFKATFDKLSKAKGSEIENYIKMKFK